MIRMVPYTPFGGVPASEVIRPNWPELRLVTGLPQLKWFSTLNASTRSSRRRIPIGMSREIPMSMGISRLIPLGKRGIELRFSAAHPPRDNPPDTDDEKP